MKFIYNTRVKSEENKEAFVEKTAEIKKQLEIIRKKNEEKKANRKRKTKHEAVKAKQAKKRKLDADFTTNKTIPKDISPKIVKVQQEALKAIAIAHEAKMDYKNRSKDPKPKIFKGIESDEPPKKETTKEQTIKAVRSKETQAENAWLMKTEKKIYRINTYSTGSIGNKPKMIDNVPTYLSSSYFKEIAAKDLMKEVLAMHQKYESSSKEYARIEACNPFTDKPIICFVSDAWSKTRASIAKDMIFKKVA